MTDLTAAKDRILRVVTAICSEGFVTAWRAGSRGYEFREHFYFDTSLRLQVISQNPETFAMHVETRRIADKNGPKTLPDACDWSLHSIVDFIQQLDDEEVAHLPQPQPRRKAVKLMTAILDTIDDGSWHSIGGTRYRAVTNAAGDPEYRDIIILTHKADSFDDKWGAETFLEQGRDL